VQGFERAYSLMLWICGVGIVIDSLERLASLSKYHDDGLFSWIVLRQRLAALPPPARRLVDGVFSGSIRLILVLVIRILAAVLVVTNPIGSALAGVGLTLLVLGQVYVLVRTGLGTIGADPITLVVCGAAWLATVAAGTSPTAARAGLWFVAAQGCLGYLVAGVAKLAAPKWRSGEAITALLSTHTYGNQRLFNLLRDRPALSRALCWSVMLWETTFPLLLCGSDSMLITQFAIGLLFHASIAGLMGLNLFLTAFPATYVAMWALRH
jgi:hypothetical protein